MNCINSSLKSSLILILILMMGFSVLSQTQDPILIEKDSDKPWTERLFYGGSLGLQFGSVTLVDISPLIGYKLTPRIGVGVSPTYKYYRFRNYYGSSYDLKTNVLGGSIFGRVLILENLFAHAEYEYLTYKSKDLAVSSVSILNEYHSVLVGAGYREHISANGYMYLLLLWNLNETIDSPYNNPIIRAGFSIGF